MDHLSASVDTSDLDRLVARLASGADDVAARAARDTATAVASRWRGRVPHRSGRLAASIGVSSERSGAALSASAPYAGWIDYGGTRGRPYVPQGRYLGPAMEGAERTFVEASVSGLDRLL